MVNFIGLGAQKAGTSWVYACLYEHPEICAPVKEIHFFSRPRFSKRKEWYEHHFRNCAAGTVSGEFSTSYLYSPQAAERIYLLYPNTKLIAILRNPKDRAYSHYRNAIKSGEIEKSMSFETFLEHDPSAIEQGQYFAQLERYRNNFSDDQLLVMIYEDSLSDPAAFIKQIYEFLGVGTAFVPSMLGKTVNVARTPRAVGVERVMHHVAEALRKVGADKLVWLVKKSGVPDLVRTANTAEVSERKPDLERIAHYFREDTKQLSNYFGRDLVTEWDV